MFEAFTKKHPAEAHKESVPVVDTWSNLPPPVERLPPKAVDPYVEDVSHLALEYDPLESRAGSETARVLAEIEGEQKAAEEAQRLAAEDTWGFDDKSK